MSEQGRDLDEAVIVARRKARAIFEAAPAGATDRETLLLELLRQLLDAFENGLGFMPTEAIVSGARVVLYTREVMMGMEHK